MTGFAAIAHVLAAPARWAFVAATPPASRARGAVRATLIAAACALLLAACERPAADPQGQPTAAGEPRRGSITISGGDEMANALNWREPEVALTPDTLEDARVRAAQALEAGDLYLDADAAVPLYLAILRLAPDDADAKRGLDRALQRLLEQGDAALALAGDDAPALRDAHVLAAVARRISPQGDAVQAYLQRVDLADRLWALNAQGEAELQARRYGAQGGGAIGRFREALRLQPGQARAMQGLAAAESGLIRNAETAAARDDFEGASRWIDLAAGVRDAKGSAIADARVRVAGTKRRRIAELRDAGLRALPEYNGVRKARDILAEMLRIAEPGNAAAAELRARIDLATHYGLFRPGQVFTDALRNGGRGPQMVVVPHGAFRMGAEPGEPGAQSYEQPSRYLRFDRGFAMSTREVTAGEFRRYLTATSARTRAARRGYSMPYDERSNNFVRRSGVDTGSDYLGQRADDDQPVIHASAVDAEDYARWLSEQTGRNYRLPSEAEFEYALRAGSTTRLPWGEAGAPPARTGNYTGSRDRSPGGRRWSNALQGYGDGHWGPAPVGSFRANAFGLYDMSGNVSEWVADCWHDGYRRAPKDPGAWFNPGCRTRVIRGGAWASSPAQLRSAWRAPLERDTTNAQIGFRVVRDL
jgi:formylglycine-generating enzyme required for sulfatase activity